MDTIDITALANLPPFDPSKQTEPGSPTNGERENETYRILLGGYDTRNEDEVSDIITNILHLCHNHGHDIPAILRRSIGHFITETA
jgi:hypothetical protein